MKHFRAYSAEFIGTLLLALGAMMSPSPILVGAILILIVYIFGSISGAHVNPVVTVGLMAMRRIAPKQGLYYIIAQVLGALAAYGLGVLVYKVGGLDLPAWNQQLQSFTGAGFTAELVAGFIFALAVAAVAWNRVPAAMSGFVVGGGLMLALTIAANIAILATAPLANPALAIAMGSLNIDYLFAPLLGGVIGFSLYHWISGEHKV